MGSSPLPLKSFLFDTYDGFADKRFKDLKKSDRFIVDDRSPSDFGADGKAYSSLCMIFAVVVDGERINVELVGNVPLSSAVRSWVDSGPAELQEEGQTKLTLPVPLENEEVLRGLASLIRDIVNPSTPRYDVPSYKYACPRTAASLERLADNLEKYRTEGRGILKVLSSKEGAEDPHDGDK